MVLRDRGICILCTEFKEAIRSRCFVHVLEPSQNLLHFKVLSYLLLMADERPTRCGAFPISK